jgi:hypothetical protein
MEKRRSFALDPVANFHIRNGATVRQIHWKGDISGIMDSQDTGFEQSFGMMINYLYILQDIENNNQRYLLDGHIPVMQPVDPTLAWAVGVMHPNSKL